MRSKVEQVFGVMELKFGFVKVRDRGLDKNANRLFVTCTLVNLFLWRVSDSLCARAAAWDKPAEPPSRGGTSKQYLFW